MYWTSRSLRFTTCVLAFWLFASPAALPGQEAGAYDAWVSALQKPSVDRARTAIVRNVRLDRDVGSFHFANGTMHLLEAVEGRTFGLVFEGEGTFSVEAPLPVERLQLERVFDSDRPVVPIRTVVILFTDSTLEELGRQVSWRPGDDGGARRKAEEALRFLSDGEGGFSRSILRPLLNGRAGLFYAHMAEHRDDPVIFAIDPYGDEDVSLSIRAERGRVLQSVAQFQSAERARALAEGPGDSDPPDGERVRVERSI